MAIGSGSIVNKRGVLVALLGAVALYFLSRQNYLLFHGVTEVFGVVIAGSIAMIAWNSRQLVRNHFLLFIGLGYPFVALISLLHTFAYKGLSVFSAEYGANLPTQLWIAARYLESFTFLAAPHFLTRRLRLIPVLIGYLLVTGMIMITIFIWPVFPDCYIEGVGLTLFKKVSEYLICLVWLAVIGILRIYRARFATPVLHLLYLAVGYNIAAELFFAVYVNPYGFFNFAGHFLRIISLYFLYRAIIEKSLNNPYRSLFREIHLSEQFFRGIYDTAPLAFVVWDQDCLVTHWNRTAEQIFGWSAAEVQGRNFFEFLVPAADRPVVEDVVKILRRGMLANRSVNTNLTKDGRAIICEWNNSILKNKDGSFKGALSLGLDITEKQQAQEMLRQQTENIKRFAYSVVHDLKSPAGSLSGLADFLRREYGDFLDDRGRLFCDQIKQVSIQISDLVQNINTYISAKELPLQLAIIDLQRLLTQLQVEFADRVAERRLTWIAPKKPPQIRGDFISLLRILRNLVDNALKYGGEGMSRIEIGFRETASHYHLYVRDDGIGVSPEAGEKIFDIFSRGQTSIGISGAGLGLAIARELAGKMGGEVWLEQPQEHGAIFYFSIARNL